MRIIFVHGWSVTDLNTYGGLPERLIVEAAARKLDLTVQHIHLGQYVSFHDEVTVDDIARGMEAALQRDIQPSLKPGERFVCITHSTGGPVVRLWWRRYYALANRSCPMSHLIMTAPANFGSALAQLGKGVLSRLKSWNSGVEPGAGVLNWLELGSQAAWDLNLDWIENSDEWVNGSSAVYPFVLTGQSIDRNLYDHVVPYTAELGSDGVVRAAAANLNSTAIVLRQGVDGKLAPDGFVTNKTRVPFLVIPRASHSGENMGIIRSVAPTVNAPAGQSLVNAIFLCLTVDSAESHAAMAREFEAQSNAVQQQELVEVTRHAFLPDQLFFHDRHAMVIFKVTDDQGFPVQDYDIILTAGERSSPDAMPRGFFRNAQRNSLTPQFLTLFLNHDVMNGTPKVTLSRRQVRPAILGAGQLGIQVQARPDRGFVTYAPAEISASRDILDTVLRPNETTLVHIILRRQVGENVFRLKTGPRPQGESFKDVTPGNPIA